MEITKIKSPTQVLHQLLADIESGELRNERGERESAYYSLASAQHGDRDFYLSVCVTEETEDSDPPWYSVHVLDDINGDDGYIVSTDTLSREELLALLVDAIHATVDKNKDKCSKCYHNWACDRSPESCEPSPYPSAIEYSSVEDMLKAAVSDLDTIMFCGGKNIDTCAFCVNTTCYGRGGDRLCDPVWLGKLKAE